MNLLQNYLNLGSQQIQIFYEEGEKDFAVDSFKTLAAAFPKITVDFAVTEPFPLIRVVLVTNRDEFDRLVRDLLQVEIEVPSHPARIAQPQRTDMVVLSPSAYEAHSLYSYIAEDFRRLLVHEFVHMVEEFQTPDIETSPRWWGEGLAVYYSEQWQYEPEFNQAALDGTAAGDIPTFARIDLEPKLAYDWGWTMVRFIEQNYGKEMILKIINQMEDGQVFAVVGEGPDQLEKEWQTWLTRENSLTV